MEKWNLIIYAPAYNVESTISELLFRTAIVVKKMKKSEIDLRKFILIDDGSDDKTKQKIKYASKKYHYLAPIFKENNRGPITALIDGMGNALKLIKNYDPKKTIIIRMDTDLEHQPEDIPKLITPIITKESTVCVGYIPFDLRNGIYAKKFNEYFGGIESKKFLGMNIPQFCPGFQAIRADVFQKVAPKIREMSERYEKEEKEKLLAIDFVMLVILKRSKEKITIKKLMPIEQKYIKKMKIKKMMYYIGQHYKTEKFLDRNIKK